MQESPVSDDVLEQTPARAFKLLGAVSSRAEIRAQLAQRGYSEEDHQRGWALVLEVAGYRAPTAPLRTPPAALDAIAALDAWDEPNFRIARAALAAFPAQLALVFDGLEAQNNAAAVGSVATFLQRLDELESRAAAAPGGADGAALAKLAARGIDGAERARLRALLELATQSAPAAASEWLPVGAGGASAANPHREELQARRRALHSWYAEWAEVARVQIKRRDFLIQLGLANRKKSEKAKV